MVNPWKAALGIAAMAAPALADWNGTLLWDPPADEFNVYARVIELQHAGGSNGKLLATWEHWYNVSADLPANDTQGSFIIRESDDDGKTWSTLTTVTDPQEGDGHPCAKFWQPFFFEFPHQIGQYPEGTILLVGNLVPTDGSYTQFYSWRSMDHGASWTPIGEWQKGGPSPMGIWEPFLYLDAQGRLIAHFSDERDSENHSQKLVQVISEDGGDTWGDVIDTVRSPAQSDRPGMPTVALMDNGEYIMSYEICGRPQCPAHVKTSKDGAEWNAEDTGVAVITDDSLFPQSSPYIVWEPTMKQLILGSLRIWYTNTQELAEEQRRAVFINTNYGQGTWNWAPSPWHVNNSSAPCNANYSPNLLVRPNGNIRYTAPTSQASGEGLCAEGTGEAQVGYLPYTADFANYQQAGWINIGGDWSVDGDTYNCAEVQDFDGKALTGSTGWTDYMVEADVQVTSDSGVVGLNTRMTAPMNGTNSFLGYMVSYNTINGNMTLSRESHQMVNLKTQPVEGGVKAGQWYHLSFSVQGFNLTARLSGDGIPSTTLSAVDASWSHGLVGLMTRIGSGAFKNVCVKQI